MTIDTDSKPVSGQNINRGALTGVTVLDLSRLLPGPYCSMILADHGAQVIAIEDKKQYAADGLYLPTVNRNKKHMTLDLKPVAGKAVFQRLLESADVVIEGFRPGVTKRLGIDYDTLCKAKDDIIYCSITGYGQTGLFKDRPGHDVNYLGYAGVLNLMGQAGQPPLIPGVQIADIAGGGMNAAIGIILALFAREKTGRGQYIDISMTDSMLSLLPVAQYWMDLTGEPPARGDNMLSHRYACYNTYETLDGRYIAVGALEGRFWKSLCQKLGFEAYAKLQLDDDRRAEIISAFRKTFLTKTMAQWEEELGGLDLCVSGVSTVDEALSAPLFRQREMSVELPEKNGKPQTAIGVPVKLSETPGSIRTPPVEFGQNTKEVLNQYGYSEEEINQLAEQDII
jgi:crotonobetainyl-CoA:carnitine CoA-transferase CaiB-like acyl-CoA transferase